MSTSEFENVNSPREGQTDLHSPSSDSSHVSKVVEPPVEQRPGSDVSQHTGNRFAPKPTLGESTTGKIDQVSMSPEQRVGDLLNVRPIGRGSRYVRGEWLGAVNRTLHDVYPPDKASGLMEAVRRDDKFSRIPFGRLHEMAKDPYWGEQITLWHKESDLLDSFRNLGKIEK